MKPLKKQAKIIICVVAVIVIITATYLTAWAIHRPRAEAFEVSFDTQGGMKIASQTVDHDKRQFVVPSDPKKIGFVFGGWYFDLDYNLKFTAVSQLTQTVTLYARWLVDELYERKFSAQQEVNNMYAAFSAPEYSLCFPLMESYKNDVAARIDGAVTIAEIDEIVDECEEEFNANIKNNYEFLLKKITEIGTVEYSKGGLLSELTGYYNALCNSESFDLLTTEQKNDLKAKTDAKKAEYLVAYRKQIKEVLTEKLDDFAKGYGDVYAAITGAVDSAKADCDLASSIEDLDRIKEETFETLALFTVDTITLNFIDGNQFPPVTGPYNGIIESLPVPEKDGYIFLGWFCGDIKFDVSGKFGYDGSGNKSVDLYPEWTPVTSDITYNFQSGTGDILTTQAKYGVASKWLVPLRNYYLFGGWYSQPDGGGIQFTGSDGIMLAPWDKINVDTTVYAKWVLLTRNIQFNANDGIGAVLFTVPVTLSQDSAPLPGIGAYSRTGYDFLGWNTAAAGNGVSYAPGSKYFMLASQASDVNLYAQWRLKIVSINYFPNTGAGETLPSEVNYNTTVTVKNAAFTKENYVFNFWTTEADGSGTKYKSGQTVPNFTESINLYAQWVYGSPELIYTLSGGTYYTVSGLSNTEKTVFVIPVSYLDLPVTAIAANAFAGRSQITGMTIPETVTSIGASAFKDCTGLSSVILPIGITSIPVSLFEGCSTLAAVTIRLNVASISASAFKNCTGLSDVFFDGQDSLNSIGENAFENCAFENIILPLNLRSVGLAAFKGCNNLKSISVPVVGSTGQTNFGAIFGAAGYMANAEFVPQSLRTINITGASTQTGIAAYAFYGCNKITSISFSSNITTIGDYAFVGCDSLVRLNSDTDGTFIIPSKTVVTLGRMFNKDNKIVDLTVPFIGGSSTQSQFLGYIFNSANADDNGTNIPDTLLSVTVTGGTTIPSKAFYNCGNIKAITYPQTVTTIGDSAFAGCGALLRLNSQKDGVYSIPGSVTSIGRNAFYNCRNLVYLYLYRNADIGITTVFGNNATGNNDNSLLNCNALKYIFVQPEAVNAYRGNSIWSAFGVAMIICEYLVIYDAKGGNTTVASTYTDVVNNVMPEIPTRRGYIFDAWYTSNGIQVDDFYSDIGSYIGIITAGNGKITLSARWTPIVYDITYNNCEAHANPLTYTVEDEFVLTAPAQRNYYDFDGWFNDDGDKILKISLGTIEDITLTARWKPIKYDITYNDGYSHTNPPSYTVEDTITFANPDLRDGYTFLGWFDNNGDPITEITAGSFGNISVTGKWQAIVYNITYNDGYSHANPLTYTVEDNTIVLADPDVRSGYTFDGWFDADDVQIFEITAGSFGYIILTGKWSVI